MAQDKCQVELINVIFRVDHKNNKVGINNQTLEFLEELPESTIITMCNCLCLAIERKRNRHYVDPRTLN